MVRSDGSKPPWMRQSTERAGAREENDMYETTTTRTLTRFGRSLALAGEAVRSDRDTAARYFWRGPRGLRPLGWNSREASERLCAIAATE